MTTHEFFPFDNPKHPQEVKECLKALVSKVIVNGFVLDDNNCGHKQDVTVPTGIQPSTPTMHDLKQIPANFDPVSGLSMTPGAIRARARRKREREESERMRSLQRQRQADPSYMKHVYAYQQQQQPYQSPQPVPSAIPVVPIQPQVSGQPKSTAAQILAADLKSAIDLNTPISKRHPVQNGLSSTAV
mmetsp:Transcript_9784/g.14313  ORF Transcript_9784/g.14313 Transcript_9784/m.14313 type:complete len:187 (-) Transcript_9784:482-1042(-)|eukprot:CAMPEP_0195518094 /NCGR_PEP_ID=MMETSP0794_2-20130614/12225_1 /TAXON_ID=515487 /ORGANISM="Stephanopyxis turris, Strain CCMP 815" /LENGTH=186 /DNA_ID=CAMNT_0040647005 /DNA_START=47 /DNA_END=607 /DNA_ORIENTATION=+